jgi:NADP-dependent 3-hydroxy acid dehydrogenase YdfG
VVENCHFSIENRPLKPTAPQKLGKNIASNSLLGKVAVVTGASGGIGRAIALALSHRGVEVCLMGRDPVALTETVTELGPQSVARSFQVDFADPASVELALNRLEKQLRKVDILIHCAGAIQRDTMERAHTEDLDLQYVVNVRAPYLLTRRLLPMLAKTRGQVIFINSSVGLAVKRPDIGQYAATKHALRAIADSLREEVNPKGIRVLTLFLGRTATPMQAKLCEEDGQKYRPETLLQPEDVATVIVHSLALPYTAEVTDISIRPMIKPAF